ncbi:hypothetical protein E2C01_025035 [Portunus trituberculatus]|uniref:Uncharacterized protein n=1 Tax=Portunus trituberculatus TaxID=210409 RepID=A0A5B7EE05_PORTR|nr:hypothetical protein [Portunus trituberculatus]
MLSHFLNSTQRAFSVKAQSLQSLHAGYRTTVSTQAHQGVSPGCRTTVSTQAHQGVSPSCRTTVSTQAHQAVSPGCRTTMSTQAHQGVSPGCHTTVLRSAQNVRSRPQYKCFCPKVESRGPYTCLLCRVFHIISDLYDFGWVRPSCLAIWPAPTARWFKVQLFPSPYAGVSSLARHGGQSSPLYPAVDMRFFPQKGLITLGRAALPFRGYECDVVGEAQHCH